MRTIEDIILSYDRRCISLLRPFLPLNFCEEAAKLVIANPGTAFITTGFFVLEVGSPETDGLLGAIAIARALTRLGYDTYFVIDNFSYPIIHSITNEKDKIIVFPLANETDSYNYASDLIRQFQPSILISVERCGVTKEGTYLNMFGSDISQYNAKVDYLFRYHNKTIGIGDGGNEIGMGNFADLIQTIDCLPKKPSITSVTNLVIASVSNWGAYGLIAALSKLRNSNLLPFSEEEEKLIKYMVKLGAVDGITKQPTNTVDGFSLKDNSEILLRLHEFLKDYM